MVNNEMQSQFAKMQWDNLKKDIVDFFTYANAKEIVDKRIFKLGKQLAEAIKRSEEFQYV